MTTRECIEFISLTDGGGRLTDENRADPNIMQSILDTGRGVAITQRYAKHGDVHPNFKQVFFPEYDADLQEDDCYTLFKCPRAVEISDVMDGYILLGPKSELSKEFTRIRSRSHLSRMRAHRVSRLLLEKDVHWMPDPGSGLIYVFRKDIKKVKMEIVAEHPTEIPGFSLEKDDYPITMDALKKVEEMVRQGTIFSYLKYPLNKTSNSMDDTQVKPNKV